MFGSVIFGYLMDLHNQSKVTAYYWQPNYAMLIHTAFRKLLVSTYADTMALHLRVPIPRQPRIAFDAQPDKGTLALFTLRTHAFCAFAFAHPSYRFSIRAL